MNTINSTILKTLARSTHSLSKLTIRNSQACRGFSNRSSLELRTLSTQTYLVPQFPHSPFNREFFSQDGSDRKPSPKWPYRDERGEKKKRNDEDEGVDDKSDNEKKDDNSGVSVGTLLLGSIFLASFF